MSYYLVQRILTAPSITVHLQAEIVELEGDDQLRNVAWRDNTSGAISTRAISNIFVMIGASPKTTWLCKDLAVDAKGFIITGSEAGQMEHSALTSRACTQSEMFVPAPSSALRQRSGKDRSSYPISIGIWPCRILLRAETKSKRTWVVLPTPPESSRIDDRLPNGLIYLSTNRPSEHFGAVPWLKPHWTMTHRPNSSAYSECLSF
jgi:hypothetical protein